MGLEQIIVRLNPDVIPNGSDLAVVNAARKSFNKRSNWDFPYEELVENLEKRYPGVTFSCENKSLKESDQRLIHFLARGMTQDNFESFCKIVAVEGRTYLIHEYSYIEDLKSLLWQWRHTPEHTSPFGHCFLSFEIKVPIFIARQLVKHKFLRWSEFSRRYITEDVEFYRHDYREAPANKKQGSGGPHEGSEFFACKADSLHGQALELYNEMVSSGIAPEQARGVLPADLMTEVTWSGSLDAFASMCRLRLGSDAQEEARHVAREVYDVLLKYYPVSAKALVEGC